MTRVGPPVVRKGSVNGHRSTGTGVPHDSMIQTGLAACSLLVATQREVLSDRLAAPVARARLVRATDHSEVGVR
jgi:hypothetical protein